MVLSEAMIISLFGGLIGGLLVFGLQCGQAWLKDRDLRKKLTAMLDFELNLMHFDLCASLAPPYYSSAMFPFDTSVWDRFRPEIYRLFPSDVVQILGRAYYAINEVKHHMSHDLIDPKTSDRAIDALKSAVVKLGLSAWPRDSKAQPASGGESCDH